MDDLSKSLPTKIEGTFDLPKVREMVQAVGERSVLQFIEFELIRMASLVSVGGNLNNAQVEFVAKQLLEDYPNETIADFKICFQNGCKGRYGDIFRMDGIVLSGWMAKYLDEKYQILEDQLMKEKESYHKVEPIEKSDLEWLEEWKKSLGPLDAKKVAPMTDQDVREEGQEKPKRDAYPSTPRSVVVQHWYHIEWVKNNFDAHTGDKLPGWMPEEEWIEQFKSRIG